MPSVEYDHMIECLSPNAANDPLRIWVLPGTARDNLDFVDARKADSLLKRCTVDGVPVPEQIPWGGIPGKCLNDIAAL